MITAEERDAVRERIRKVKRMIDEETGTFAMLQLLYSEVAKRPSPADEMLYLFRKGCAGRDAAAELMLTLAMTCSSMLVLDIMQDESAKLN